MNLSPEFVVYARESGQRASGDKKRLGGPHRQHEVSLLAKEGNARGSEQEVWDRQTLIRVMSHSCSRTQPQACSESRGSQAGARAHTQACWEIKETAKLYKLQKEREKELKGKVLGTHMHAHTDTHTDGAGMTHE